MENECPAQQSVSVSCSNVYVICNATYIAPNNICISISENFDTLESIQLNWNYEIDIMS